MGFKCPVCLKDFGFDKLKWSEHIKSAHQGIGEDIRKIVKEITESPNQPLDHDAKQPPQVSLIVSHKEII